MKRRIELGIGWVLAAASLLWVSALFGFASGLLSSDPPAVNPYAVGSTPESEPARFIVSAVGLEGEGWVEIKNVGGEAGSTAGFWLCNRPSYFALPAIDLTPGATIVVAAGDGSSVRRGGDYSAAAAGSIGTLDPGGGEVGLYDSSNFGDPGSMLAYVAWGSAGQGRQATAAAAGLWPEAGFVPAAGLTVIEATDDLPLTPGSWTGG